MQSEPVRRLVTSLKDRKSSDKIELLDAAYWIKGCSSLGRLRYAVLVGVGKKRNAENGVCFLDLKEATKAAAPRAVEPAMPHDYATRVVTGARALSPNLGDRMVAAKLDGVSVVVRELMPQDLKLEVDSLTPDQAVQVARYLSGVVGHAHARQIQSDADVLAQDVTAVLIEFWMPRLGFGTVLLSWWPAMKRATLSIAENMRWLREGDMNDMSKSLSASDGANDPVFRANQAAEAAADKVHDGPVSKWFTRLASATSHAAGRPATFALCCVTVIVWAVTGPMFHYSDTWQLVINTGTTIVTFLMVFLI